MSQTPLAAGVLPCLAHKPAAVAPALRPACEARPTSNRPLTLCTSIMADADVESGEIRGHDDPECGHSGDEEAGCSQHAADRQHAAHGQRSEMSPSHFSPASNNPSAQDPRWGLEDNGGAPNASPTILPGPPDGEPSAAGNGHPGGPDTQEKRHRSSSGRHKSSSSHKEHRHHKERSHKGHRSHKSHHRHETEAGGEGETHRGNGVEVGGPERHRSTKEPRSDKERHERVAELSTDRPASRERSQRSEHERSERDKSERRSDRERSERSDRARLEQGRSDRGRSDRDRGARDRDTRRDVDERHRERGGSRRGRAEVGCLAPGLDSASAGKLCFLFWLLGVFEFCTGYIRLRACLGHSRRR